MIHRVLLTVFCVVVLGLASWTEIRAADGGQAFGRQWGRGYTAQEWNRFYYYPYVYYPHNFYPPEYFRSGSNPMQRYPEEMRIPTYNPSWVNYYSSPRRYHQGKHFILDVY
ncbi:MAG: hypothetical protein LBQ54_02370 [Planctomycetaceae bacterium]|jgi:hypothetical protein|nr:hypothetical protein [Planctomycetaceae bacterium]